MRYNLLESLHASTVRDYFGRMSESKAHNMEVAKAYGEDYWDGDRKYGYGGYRYDGRWQFAAAAVVERYKLGNDSSVLDLGCGKAHLLAELKKMLPGLQITGLDISAYALQNAPLEVRSNLRVMDLRQCPWPFEDGQFDLVLSLNLLHNFHLPELSDALKEIERIGRRKYIVVESYRTDRELTHLQCWALTCASFYKDSDWEFLFKQQGYTGDYGFIFFE